MGSCSSNVRKKVQKNSEVRQFSQQDIRHFYKLGQVIGRGNFGTVQLGYKVEQERKGFKAKCFAIKCIDKERIGLEQIQRELEILSRLDHPNIIRVYEEYEDLNHFYFVMEYCKGGELLQYILKHGAQSERMTQVIMRQLFSAVGYLHERGIIHRDLKPENLMMANAEGEFDIRIIDFGLSKREQVIKKPSQQRSKCRHQTKVGTPIYVAPEVLKGVYSETCDEWSLGCIMYALLFAEPPFSGQNIHQLEQQINKPHLKFKLGISSECQDLITKLLEPNPNKRITCLQALKHPWMIRDQNQCRLLTTMQSEENSLEIERIIELLRQYSESTQFKKEALRILLSQLTDQQQNYLKLKFEELDRDNSGTINEAEFLEYLEQQGKSKLFKQLPMEKFSKNDQGCYISYTDFMAALLNQPFYLTQDRLDNLFFWYDIKHRQYISKTDYRIAMSRRGVVISLEKTDGIFLGIEFGIDQI
ncbi:unnamed protein product (macronuclear) [Paramecium tetraurelia]|uniref:Protein kinase domain-containing protein n=1 Tax=Paramecium tetraurelia TaxID=5888 RepID=A0D5N6_PARTE|nr:uncharacterized protein GSPATT00013783001 [Paramecium tetraurelia]CAK78353.1 unnamed protein product [Paramecium tetraurelia]|eukprot:XP_001445750.1 hypothetical protein (macronuclear) [Paramecium tetraurelia strain d4-2]